MEQYPRTLSDDDDDDDSDTSGPVPAPAAAAPQNPVTKISSSVQCPEVRHRIRIFDKYGDKEPVGYLGPAANSLPVYWANCLNAASPEEDAFIVVTEPSADTSNLFRFLVVGPESSRKKEWLGFEWEDGLQYQAAITLFRSPEARTDVWHIDLEGNVVPKWYDSENGT
ncbi:hypothetical protein FRC00_013549, partial [Tulasnella sp. 408]